MGKKWYKKRKEECNVVEGSKVLQILEYLIYRIISAHFTYPLTMLPRRVQKKTLRQFH